MPKRGAGKARRKRERSARRGRYIAFGWRALVWLVVVFGLLPWGFDYFDSLKLFSFNANVAGLFVLALLGAFALLRRDELFKRRLSWQWQQAVLFGLIAVVLFALSFRVQQSYWPHASYLNKAVLILWMQITYALASLCLAITLFGLELFLKESRALLTGAVVGVSYVGISLLFRQLWPVLSNLVIGLNAVALRCAGDVSAIAGPAPALKLNDFFVIIGDACSGVDSAIMFSGVFLFIALLDWPRLKHKLFIGMLPFGLIGMFLVNVLRVGLLMVIGAWYSPDFALTMFHANAGWILFVLYTLGFWWWAYPHVRKKTR